MLVGTAVTPVGTDAQYAKFAVRGNTINSNGAYLSLGNGKSTADTTSNDNLGLIVFNDNDSSDAGEYARIVGATDGANGTNDYPGKLVFYTTSDGASAPTEKLRITSDGKVGIGTNAPNEELHIHANGTSYVRFTDESSGTGALDGVIFGLDHPHLYAWNYEAGDFVVAANATEKFRVKSGGDVEIKDGNLVIGTSGKGIDFSATSSTGTSELLNDYEEGTFTATCS